MEYVGMVYHVNGRRRAAEVGRLLDRRFPRDVLTGLNFLVRYDGDVAVAAYFDGDKVDEASLELARETLERYGREGEESFEELLDRKEYVEYWLGSPEAFILLHGGTD